LPTPRETIRAALQVWRGAAGTRARRWPLSGLQSHARNAKAHGAAPVARIVAGMVGFG